MAAVITKASAASVAAVAASVAALVTGVSSFNSRTGAITPTTGDYTSTQITNSSNASGTGVTGALNTLEARSASSWTWYTVGSPATTSVRYAHPRNGGVATTAYNNGIYVVPFPCTAAGIAFATNNVNILATDSIAATLVKASSGTTTMSDTSCTLTVPANTAFGTTVSASCNASLAAGDQLAMKLVQSGTENQASWVSSITVTCK